VKIAVIDEELKELKDRLMARFGFWHKVSVMVGKGPDGQRLETEAVRKIQVEADTASLLERAISDTARVKEKALDALHARGTKGLRTDLLTGDFYTFRRYPTVSDAAQVTAALKELCKEEQLYVEGHKGRNLFGETPYGLDEHSRAMLYHADFAQNDFHVSGKSDKLERVVRELGFSLEGLKLKRWTVSTSSLNAVRVAELVEGDDPVATLFHWLVDLWAATGRSATARRRGLCWKKG